MNSCWHILDIAPTSDTRAIRKAYAARLKTTRPDDDAAAYQSLREAFDEAMRIAPYQEETTFRQPETGETENQTANGENETFAALIAPSADWIAQAGDILEREGAAGLIRHRMDLTRALEHIPPDQRLGAERFWLGYLRAQNRSLPLLWTFGASWFGWWEGEGLTQTEAHALNGRKYHEVDWVHSPAAFFQRLCEFAENPPAMEKFWFAYPDETEAFTEAERQTMGLLLRRWHDWDRLPEKLRSDWQARYPEFSQETPPEALAAMETHLAQLNAAWQTGGAAAVWALQAQTEALFDRLPAAAIPLWSQRLLQTLRNWQTQSPQLWGSWGKRFNWRDSPFPDSRLTDFEREYFYYQQVLPELMRNPSALAECMDDSYQRFQDGRAEIGYIWDCLKDGLWALSAEETAALDNLFRHYLEHYPQRLPENVFADWYARTEHDNAAFRQPENNPDTAELPTAIIPQDIADHLSAHIREHGAGSLNRYWPNIRTLLQRLPLGAEREASQVMLAFLRGRNITDPLVWAQWADYFGWADDYQAAAHFSAQEMEDLKVKISQAALIGHAAKQSAHARRIQDQAVADTIISPHLHQLAVEGKAARATLLGWLLRHHWRSQWNSPHMREALAHSALYQVVRNSDTVQLVWLTVLAAAVFAAFIAAPAEFQMSFYLNTFGLLTGCTALLLASQGLRFLIGERADAFQRRLQKGKTAWIIGVWLPLAAALVYAAATYPSVLAAALFSFLLETP